MDELHAKYGGPTWGIDQDVRNSTKSSNGMTLEQVLEHYKTHHLTAPKQPPAKSKSKRDRGDFFDSIDPFRTFGRIQV
jgi:hypothetical protein